MTSELLSGLPATLGEVRWLDARSLLASCRACAHESVLNVETLADTVPLSSLATDFVCKYCGALGAYILPSWSEKPDGAPIA
jgi:hypothetical protein